MRPENLSTPTMGPTRLPGYLGTPGVSGGGGSRGMKLLILSLSRKSFGRCFSFPPQLVWRGAQKGDLVLFLPPLLPPILVKMPPGGMRMIWLYCCTLVGAGSVFLLLLPADKKVFFLGKIKQEKLTPVHSAKTHSGIIAHCKSTCTAKAPQNIGKSKLNCFFKSGEKYILFCSVGGDLQVAT